VPDQWTSQHRGDGIASVAVIFNPVKAKDFQKIYPAGSPDRMPASFAMQRQLLFDWRDSTQTVYDPRTWKYSENPVLARVHYELVRKTRPPSRAPGDAGYWAEIANIYGERWNKRFAPTLDYLTAAANDCDVPVPLKGVQTILAVKGGPRRRPYHRHLDQWPVHRHDDRDLGNGRHHADRDAYRVLDRGFVVRFLARDLANDHPVGSQVSWASIDRQPGDAATLPDLRRAQPH
jgi:hypothetical protein